MEEHLRGSEPYDFRRYDRLWQRVAPGLEPYPSPAPEGAARPQTPAEEAPAEAAARTAAPAVREESRLPGAAENPCCMGSAAEEMLAVLTGFAEEELEDQRQLQALAR